MAASRPLSACSDQLKNHAIAAKVSVSGWGGDSAVREPAVGGCRRCPALGKPRARHCRGATAIEHHVDDVAEAATRRRLVSSFLMLFYKYEIVTAW